MKGIAPKIAINIHEVIVKTNACLRSIFNCFFLKDINKTKPIKKVNILE